MTVVLLTNNLRQKECFFQGPEPGNESYVKCRLLPHAADCLAASRAGKRNKSYVLSNPPLAHPLIWPVGRSGIMTSTIRTSYLRSSLRLDSIWSLLQPRLDLLLTTLASLAISFRLVAP